MTEAHDWPRYPFAVGEPVNTRCCVCGERFTVPRPADAGVPWDAQCASCGAMVGVCENAIIAWREAEWKQQMDAAWERRKAEERAAQEAQLAHWKGVEDERQKRARYWQMIINSRAHLAQCIEPTPNQRDVWHEYRIEDAYRA